jgi:hypothetical protein
MLLCDITFTTMYSQISLEIILFVVNLSRNKLNTYTYTHNHTQKYIHKYVKRIPKS